ncbi:hypothetical protein H0G86_010749 [Trichoderma simmonsii]|uniref:Uncharacterized protein n=1 Tax=Trichoderma simmonsii TaxID=1491479 RepID=A0A8G0PII9_9HYPO|nr:hypothetical protein H0G86_010749 [Trichoderma simmonsii]
MTIIYSQQCRPKMPEPYVVLNSISSTLFNCQSLRHFLRNMPDSSARIAHNATNVSIGVRATTDATHSVHDHDHSYSLNRFLSEPTHTTGYGQEQSPAEAETRMLEELRKFEMKFSSSSPPQRNKE